MQRCSGQPKKGGYEFDPSRLDVTGRKAWKTLKGKGEAVWPPHLCVMISSGLAAYQPDTKSNKVLNRFPRRNRYISEYIYSRTGEWRTAKQVSSRLQQLKESCKDIKILEKLKLEAYNQTHPSQEPDDPSPRVRSLPAPTVSLSDSERIQRSSAIMQDAVFPHTFCLDPRASNSEIYIDLNTAARYDAPSFLSSEIAQPPILYFASRVALFPETVCTLFEGDGSVPLHRAACPLSFYGFSQTRDQLCWHYTSVLPASIWQLMREHRHSGSFQVLQNVIMDHEQGQDAAMAGQCDLLASANPMISALYRFVHTRQPASQPSPSTHLSVIPGRHMPFTQWECVLPPAPPLPQGDLAEWLQTAPPSDSIRATEQATWPCQNSSFAGWHYPATSTHAFPPPKAHPFAQSRDGLYDDAFVV
ncbi:hypothetical protein HDZ31DRAFT_48689 [Schizophyllum fasciatum]